MAGASEGGFGRGSAAPERRNGEHERGGEIGGGGELESGELGVISATSWMGFVQGETGYLYRAREVLGKPMTQVPPVNDSSESINRVGIFMGGRARHATDWTAQHEGATQQSSGAGRAGWLRWASAGRRDERERRQPKRRFNLFIFVLIF